MVRNGKIGSATAGMARGCAAALRIIASALRARTEGTPLLRKKGDPVANGNAIYADDASRKAHLAKLAERIGTEARQVERAGRCHDAAGVRLDAAIYELEQLRRELACVVDPSLLASTGRLLDAAANLRGGDDTQQRPESSIADPAEVKASPAGSWRPAA